MSIGKNIFELRKNLRLTQSELAGKLGVTEQSVSKWENDVCAPDVALFPQLAKLFNVSIDRLYGFHLDSYDREVQRIIDAEREAATPYDEIAYYEKALALYPNSDKLKLSLAFAQSMLVRIGETEAERKMGAEKAIAVLNEILGTSFDESMLDDAHLMLSRIYSETGRFGEATETLARVSTDKHGSLVVSKAQILAESKNYEELRRHVEKELYDSYVYMDILANVYYIALYEQGDCEQALQYCELRDKLLRLFDGRGATLYTCNKMMNAFQKAHMLRRSGRKEDCYQTLLYFSEMAGAALAIPDAAGHRVSVLNGFFGTVDVIEQHTRASDVKKYAAQMLSQFKEYFGDDTRLHALLKKFAEE